MPETSRPAAFHLLLCGSLVLYVYRVFLIGVNVSLFRIVLAAWSVVMLVDLVRRRVPLTRLHAVLAALSAAIVVVNLVEFTRVAGYPAIRRDILNHLLNVWFTCLLAVSLRSRAEMVSLLTAFVWSSVVTSVVTLASWGLGALPFEAWLRHFGGPAARQLRYLGYDFYFHRATSAFYDPNFYGIYSALVVVTALGLWSQTRARALPCLIALNLFFLGATLSRTGLLGLIAALVAGATVLPDWRTPAVRRAAAITTAALLVCFLAASVVQSRVNRARAAIWLAGVWQSTPGPTATYDPAKEAAKWKAPPDQDRVTGSASVADRFRRIEHGWGVFREGPWLGSGGAALLSPAFPPHPSAHVVYLTLLARYGIVGTLVYAGFALVPLAVAWRRCVPPVDTVVLSVAACLAVVYLSYDVFLGFEIQYLFFGVAWAAAAQHERRLDAVGI